MNVSNIYRFYINDILLPQTPASFTISNENNNETVMLANGRPFTIAKLDGAQTFEFEFEITQKAYPYTFSDALEGIRFYTDLVWQLKEDRNPVRLTILRSRGQPATCVNALLWDYSYVEDADNAGDYTFKLVFKEYHPQNNQELDVQIEHHLITAGNARGWVDESGRREISDAAKQAAEEERQRLEKEQKLAEKEKEAQERKDGQEGMSIWQYSELAKQKSA